MQAGRLIGLTGGIGAGKSIVSRVLRLLGYEVYDCDSQAKRLMDADKRLHEEIAVFLGEMCINPDGTLCRPAIASRIFADEDARSWLNSRVHATVREDILCSFLKDFHHSEIENRNNSSGSRVRFVESAVLRSSGLWKMCDEIWIVEAPEELRIDRVVARSGLTPEEIRARMMSQKDEFEFSSIMPPSNIRILFNDGVTPMIPSIKDYLDSVKK